MSGDMVQVSTPVPGPKFKFFNSLPHYLEGGI